MAKAFKVGDHVSWNSEAGRVRGKIVKVHKRPVNYKGYIHRATLDEPQYRQDRPRSAAQGGGVEASRLTLRREFESTAVRMRLPFFTIGHSSRPIGEFIDLLTASEIGVVVDVRTVPRSRANPQYNCEALPESLSGFQIAYEHVAELGGLRARAKDIAPEVNAFWQNQSFHNYADYAMSGGFRSGLTRLRDLGRLRRCAVMCAEAVWWRCHRRIIADYSVVGGDQLFHILAPGKVAIASLTTAAGPGPEDTVTYPAQ